MHVKQLLARGRYLLFKSADKWMKSQNQRAAVLFERYPDLKEAYSLTHSVRMIFSKNTVKDAARLSLARWYDKVDNSRFKSFLRVYCRFPSPLEYQKDKTLLYILAGFGTLAYSKALQPVLLLSYIIICFLTITYRIDSVYW